MRALILAAGRGNRLDPDGNNPPKCLLRFGGRSLLDRHLDLLAKAGVDEVVIGVGHRADEIEAEIAARPRGLDVRTIYNPDFHEGSVVSLWHLRAALCAGGDVLLMDADVLYDWRMLDRLVGTPQGSCFLVDQNGAEGDEPVRVCIRDGRPVEFQKGGHVPCEVMGESVGFFRLDTATAQALAACTEIYVERGDRAAPHEDALRDVLHDLPPHTFGWEDVTGLPWIEIDFPADVTRARDEILPRLQVGPVDSLLAMDGDGV